MSALGSGVPSACGRLCVCRLVTKPSDWRLTDASFVVWNWLPNPVWCFSSVHICDMWLWMRAKTKWRRVWNYFVLRATTIWRSRHLRPLSALTLSPCLLPRRQPEALVKRYVHTVDFFFFAETQWMQWREDLGQWWWGSVLVLVIPDICMQLSTRKHERTCSVLFRELMSTCTVGDESVPFHLPPRTNWAQSHTRPLSTGWSHMSASQPGQLAAVGLCCRPLMNRRSDLVPGECWSVMTLNSSSCVCCVSASSSASPRRSRSWSAATASAPAPSPAPPAASGQRRCFSVCPNIMLLHPVIWVVEKIPIQICTNWVQFTWFFPQCNKVSGTFCHRCTVGSCCVLVALLVCFLCSQPAEPEPHQLHQSQHPGAH